MAQRKLTVEKTARKRVKDLYLNEKLYISSVNIVKLISTFKLKKYDEQIIKDVLDALFDDYYNEMKNNTFLHLNEKFNDVSYVDFLKVCNQDNSKFINALIERYYNFHIYRDIFKKLNDEKYITYENIDIYKNDTGFKNIKFKQAEKEILKHYNDYVFKFKY